MQNSKSISTPMTSNVMIDKDENDLEIDIIKYRGIIGSLFYLTASRPNIMFNVCMCVRFSVLPRESHFKIVKKNWGSGCILVGFSDSDFAGCMSGRKSTSGTYHLFRKCLVSWHIKKLDSVALSSIGAEYIVAGNCCA